MARAKKTRSTSTWKEYHYDEAGEFRCPEYSAQRSGPCSLSSTEVGAGLAGGKPARIYQCPDGHRFAITAEQTIGGPKLRYVTVQKTPDFGSDF